MNDYVSRVEDVAFSIFGDRAEVYRFMTTPNASLGDQTPAEVVSSGQAGVKEVLGFLRQLEAQGD